MYFSGRFTVFLVAILAWHSPVLAVSESKKMERRDGHVLVHFFRVKQFAGLAIKPRLLINGVEIGKITNGCVFSVYIPKGTIRLETKIPIINHPIKGGVTELRMRDETPDELYLRYRTDVTVLAANQHFVSAQYSTGFEVV